MAADNLSFVMRGIDTVAFENRPIPDIADDECLVEVKKTGICGSDVHFLVHGRIGDYVVNNPMVLGHESAGVVAKVGKNVKHLAPGARVAMEPGAVCRVCTDCKRGRYELCPDIVFAATPPTDGTLARFYRIPSDLCYALPDALTLEDGAMMEPLAVAVHAVHTRGALRANESVLVFGAGPVGLLCMAVARALGAARVLAADIVPARLAFARRYAGADTFLVPARESGEDASAYAHRSAAALRKELGVDERGPRGVDLVVDASGAPASVYTGLLVAKHGGRYVQVGMGSPNVTVPITTVLVKELSVTGSFRYGPGDYELALGLAAAARVDLRPLVTHRFAFDEAPAAFDAVRRGAGPDGRGVVKVVIDGPGEKAA